MATYIAALSIKSKSRNPHVVFFNGMLYLFTKMIFCLCPCFFLWLILFCSFHFNQIGFVFKRISKEFESKNVQLRFLCSATYFQVFHFLFHFSFEKIFQEVD